MRAEAVFRAMFFSGILLLPAGRAVAPGAVIGGGVWPFALGVVIGWLGLLLRWWSFVSLGKYFTVVVKTSEDQPVVERGPYLVLRHPSYTGLLLAFAGGAFRNADDQVARAAAILGAYERDANEALRSAFGAATLPEHVPPSAAAAGQADQAR